MLASLLMPFLWLAILLAQCGHDKFAVRQRATAKLQSWFNNLPIDQQKDVASAWIYAYSNHAERDWRVRRIAYQWFASWPYIDALDGPNWCNGCHSPLTTDYLKRSQDGPLEKLGVDNDGFMTIVTPQEFTILQDVSSIRQFAHFRYASMLLAIDLDRYGTPRWLIDQMLQTMRERTEAWDTNRMKVELPTP